MNKAKRILVMLFVLLLSFGIVSALASCDASDIEEAVNNTFHTVTFDTDGGSKIESVTVKNGSKITEPEAPKKEGYTFLGWYIGDEKWSFVGYVVTENTTLTAKWEKNAPEVVKHTVTFNTDGGNTIAPIEIISGEKVAEPETPKKDGYTFLGWYLGDEKWSFVGYVVTENITLTAKWEKNVIEVEKYTVSFDTGTDIYIPSIEVVKGEKVAAPENPERMGYGFLGWYFGDEKWSFIGYVVTEDMTLTAKWEAIVYFIHVDDDVNGSYSFEYTVESDTFTVPTPMNTAYKKFIGWNVGDSDELVSEVTVEKGAVGNLNLTAVYKDICLYHIDADGDGYCDQCDNYVYNEECKHNDKNGDTRCDVCGVCVHYDVEGDKLCDYCGKDASNKIVMKPLWDSASIIMQLNRCSNNSELSSALARYIAGERSYSNSIDKAVAKRNIAATEETKVSVTYKYWDDDSIKNGWGDTIGNIDAFVNSTTIKDTPDVYSTFIYDLVGASVRGYFANLKGTVRGSGKLKGLNYFEFVYDKDNYEKEYKYSAENDRGFMYDWMQSVTLDPNNRMYVLASDYYIDMIRAMTIIPVNIEILEEVASEYPDLTGDRDGDGDVDQRDFYDQVRAGEWTFDLLMAYSQKAYIADNNSATLDKWLGDKQIGFAMSDGNVANSGIIYSTPISVIHKTWNAERNDYDYYYPGSDKDPRGKEAGLAEFNNGIGKLVDAVEELLAADGVVYVKREYCNGGTWNDVSGYSANTEHQAIRVAFSQGSVLFGDIIMAGALEEKEYQKMGGNAFGVLPVPIYHDNIDEDGNAISKYYTQIHSVGRAGAIAFNTMKFVECTAFLNYQSTNSTKIIDDYFTYELCYTVSGGQSDTVWMLQYLRDNIRPYFDRGIEEAISVFFDYEWGWGDYRIISLIENDFAVPNLEADYASCVDTKQEYLDTLLQYFKQAKD